MNRKIILPIVFVVVFAIARIPKLLPPDFSAAYALAFCAGVYFRGPMAWWLPLGLMAVTDIALDVFYYHYYAFWTQLLVNSVCYAMLIGLGKSLSKSAPFWKLLSGGILGALIFYLLTNTLSWLTEAGYPKTFVGWIQALFTGLPGLPPSWEFFRNTLLSGGLFTALFVGAAKATEESPAEKTAGAAEPVGEETADEAVKG